MFPFTERRKQRLEKLFDRIEDASDAQLQAILTNSPADEIAVILGVFSIERASRVLAAISPERITQALGLLKNGEKPTEAAAARLADAVGDLLPASSIAAATASAPMKDAPFVVKAMDMAGKVFGTFSLDGKKTAASEDPASRDATA